MKNNSDKKKKNKIISTVITVSLVVFLVAGLIVLIYPSFSDWWNTMHATRSIADYTAAVEAYDDASIMEKISEAEKYNNSLALGTNFEMTDEDYAKYEELLDISGTGIMGYVSIPAISVNLPIYHGTSEAVLQVAAGHLAGSSLPVGGKSSHTIISGHRGLPSAKLFTDLDMLVIGDTFSITVLNQVYTYRIDQIKVVLPDDVSELGIQKGKDYCTLITCTPYGINTHRMLVRGHRVENEKEDLVVVITPDATKVPNYVVGVVMALFSLIIVTTVYLVFSGVKKKNISYLQIIKELKQ